MVRVGLALCLAAAGCHNDPCYEAGFDEGERFQFTMLDVQKRLLGPADAQPNPCDELPLAAGDTFILVGGSKYDDGGVFQDCSGRSARPDVPSFATDVVTSCEEIKVVFGLQCTTETSTACGFTFATNLRADIEPGATTISRAELYIGAHDSCAGAGCDLYSTVRIDRLPP